MERRGVKSNICGWELLSVARDVLIKVGHVIATFHPANLDLDINTFTACWNHVFVLTAGLEQNNAAFQQL
jgi:hypothetical protein